MENDNILKFAFVADNDVFHFFQIPNIPQLDGVIAGLKSGPTVIEVTDIYNTIVDGKWKYIDGSFIRDIESKQLDHNHSVDEDDYEVE